MDKRRRKSRISGKIKNVNKSKNTYGKVKNKNGKKERQTPNKHKQPYIKPDLKPW